jgi:triosephosphate isomerase
MPRKLAAGNWKMNGTAASLSELAGLGHSEIDVLICPPATLIASAAARNEPGLHIGAQDCQTAASGAHTGDISAPMLADAGASHVILGHSERRADHGESSDDTRAKALAVLDAGLMPIICIGETLAQREAGQTLEILTEQLHASTPDSATSATTIIAYEPVWAIGTGLTATTDQIAEVHAHLRAELTTRFGPDGANFSLLYGGSVKAGNASEIFATPNVNGALVGGASLKSTDFRPIIDALAAA